MRELLPVGSVVLLKDSKKRLVISSRVQKTIDSDKIWDYSGYYYPEGNIDPENCFLFDNEQIDRVYFIGFQDEEELLFREKLMQVRAAYESQGKGVE